MNTHINVIRNDAKLLKILERNSGLKIKNIYSMGSFLNTDSLSLAVVGTRKMSDYGRAVIKNIIPGLVNRGITIISGMMTGVDIEAHNCTLDNNGRTIGVLGYGLDYLDKNKEAKHVCDRMLKLGKGGVVSEYDYYFKPTKWSFPKRNRVVAGLSKAVLVIEADLKSGTSITANYAISQNKPVFVVPGSIFNRYSLGTNKLIKDGGLLVESSEDILNYLGLKTPSVNKINLGDDESKILKFMSTESHMFDEITMETGLSRSYINMLLTKLELNGILSRDILGRWYRL